MSLPPGLEGPHGLSAPLVNDGSALRIRIRHRVGLLLPSFVVAAGDALVVVGAVLFGMVVRQHLPVLRSADDMDSLVQALFLPLVVAWLTLLAAGGAYSRHTLGAGAQEYKQVLRATMSTAAILGIGCYLFQIQLSRGFFFLTFAIGIPALLLGRYILRRALHQVRQAGRLQQRVVLVGAPRQVDEVAAVLMRERWLGYSVLGAIVPGRDFATETPRGVAVLGSTANTASLVRDAKADVVLFAGGGVDSAQAMRRTVWELEDANIQVMVAPSLTDVANDRIKARPAAGLPLIEIEGPNIRLLPPLFKRAFDLGVASAVLVLSLPVLAATALAVKLHDGGPVLFRQERVGRRGETFSCLKLRSMVVDADARLAELNAVNKHGDDHVLFKVTDDPRVTRPGRFIRRFSIDELPQLVNVLRGEMSLIGPRPPLPREVARYSGDVRRRLAVRPGMTGLWQVSGRSDLSWEDSVRLDLYYADNWSLTQDLVILGRTAHAVLSSRGAY